MEHLHDVLRQLAHDYPASERFVGLIAVLVLLSTLAELVKGLQ